MVIFFVDMLDGYVYMIESNQCKVVFLRIVLWEMGVKGIVYVGWIELVVKEWSYGFVDVVFVCVLVLLDFFLCFVELFMVGGVKVVFYKGQDFQCELDEVVDFWQFDLVEKESFVDFMSWMFFFFDILFWFDQLGRCCGNEYVF